MTPRSLLICSLVWMSPVYYLNGSRHAQGDPLVDIAVSRVESVYVARDDVAGPYAVKEFQALKHANRVPLLPDDGFCQGYVVLNDGSFCFPARRAVSFELRRFEPTSVTGAREAASLVKEALGANYEKLRPFFTELVEHSTLRCVSFFVSQFDRVSSDVRSSSELYEEADVELTGMSCRMNDHVFTLTHDGDAFSDAPYKLWDAFQVETEQFLLVERLMYEAAAFELYRIEDGQPHLVRTIQLWSL